VANQVSVVARIGPVNQFGVIWRPLQITDQFLKPIAMLLSVAAGIEGLVAQRRTMPAIIVEIAATKTEEEHVEVEIEDLSYFVADSDWPSTFTFQWFATE